MCCEVSYQRTQSNTATVGREYDGPVNTDRPSVICGISHAPLSETCTKHFAKGSYHN